MKYKIRIGLNLLVDYGHQMKMQNMDGNNGANKKILGNAMRIIVLGLN